MHSVQAHIRFGRLRTELCLCRNCFFSFSRFTCWRAISSFCFASCISTRFSRAYDRRLSSGTIIFRISRDVSGITGSSAGCPGSAFKMATSDLCMASRSTFWLSTAEILTFVERSSKSVAEPVSFIFPIYARRSWSVASCSSGGGLKTLSAPLKQRPWTVHFYREKNNRAQLLRCPCREQSHSLLFFSP